MSEHQLNFEEQNDILYIPGFLLKVPPKVATGGQNIDDEADDFLKNTRGWSECNFTDDCFE
jgi:hypothetical protein